MRRSEDDRHQAERQQRRSIDGLRSKIKHLDPPVGVNDSWEQVRPRIHNLDDFRALDSDDLRRTAFEKVIRRLKEKEEDSENDRIRREKERERSVVERQSHRRHDRDRERDRDRDRDRERNRERDRERERARERDRDARGSRPPHHRSRRHSRHSRTPEPDAYEADRKRAQAERERQFRKASIASMSPTHPRGERERDRGRERDRERDGDRDRPSSRNANVTHYDRERRAREEERERLYRSRGDPRGGRDELDYGENKAAGGAGSTGSRRRGRADSDVESVGSRRESKVSVVVLSPTSKYTSMWIPPRSTISTFLHSLRTIIPTAALFPVSLTQGPTTSVRDEIGLDEAASASASASGILTVNLKPNPIPSVAVPPEPAVVNLCQCDISACHRRAPNLQLGPRPNPWIWTRKNRRTFPCAQAAKRARSRKIRAVMRVSVVAGCACHGIGGDLDGEHGGSANTEAFS